MSEAAWAEISPERYEDYWAPFEARFHFRASTKSDGWPAIDEPAPSVTLDLSPIFHSGPSGFAAGQDAVNALALLAMTRVMAPTERLLVLNWQHSGHWFRPHRHAVSEDRAWPVAVFPNGDYFMFLTEDLTAGTFGHPWEQTLCVFGDRFVDVLAPMLSAWLPVRRSRTVH